MSASTKVLFRCCTGTGVQEVSWLEASPHKAAGMTKSNVIYNQPEDLGPLFPRSSTNCKIVQEDHHVVLKVVLTSKLMLRFSIGSVY